MKKTLIFDFDGTIADSMKLVKRLANKLLPTIGLNKVDDEDIEKLRSMTIPQGMKYLNIPIYRLPKIIIQGRMLMKQNIADLKPIEGIEEALSMLKDKEFNLGIITSNSKENVEVFLKNNNMTKYFDFIDAGAGAFNKSWRIKSVVKKRNLNPKKCIYVGDEIRDIQAAKAAGLKSVAVSWGVNDLNSLKKEKPEKVLSKPHELLEVV